MTKRLPPSKVAAFPLWRTRAPGGPGMIETVEHPDTGEWWVRNSYLVTIPGTGGRQAWAWSPWTPAKAQPRIDRSWRIQRPHYSGSVGARPGRYRKAMLPVETEIPR